MSFLGGFADAFLPTYQRSGESFLQNQQAQQRLALLRKQEEREAAAQKFEQDRLFGQIAEEADLNAAAMNAIGMAADEGTLSPDQVQALSLLAPQERGQAFAELTGALAPPLSEADKLAMLLTQADIDLKGAQADKARRPPKADNFAMVLGRDLGLPGELADVPFNIDLESGKVSQIGGGGVTVNTGDLGPKMGPVPPGMVAVPDQSSASGFRAVPMAGGPAEQEMQETAEKELGRQEEKRLDLDSTMRDINRVLALSREGAGGPLEGQIGQGRVPPGPIGEFIAPFTGSGEMVQHLESIKANLAFDALQAMRDNSPTGGAVGQLSEGEREALSSAAGALDPRLPEKELQRNLIDFGVKRITTVHGTDAQIDAAVKAGKITEAQGRQGKTARDAQIKAFRARQQTGSEVSGQLPKRPAAEDVLDASRSALEEELVGQGVPRAEARRQARDAIPEPTLGQKAVSEMSTEELLKELGIE